MRTADIGLWNNDIVRLTIQADCAAKGVSELEMAHSLEGLPELGIELIKAFFAEPKITGFGSAAGARATAEVINDIRVGKCDRLVGEILGSRGISALVSDAEDLCALGQDLDGAPHLAAVGAGLFTQELQDGYESI
jgi:hypothetical protein